MTKHFIFYTRLQHLDDGSLIEILNLARLTRQRRPGGGGGGTGGGSGEGGGAGGVGAGGGGGRPNGGGGGGNNPNPPPSPPFNCPIPRDDSFRCDANTLFREVDGTCNNLAHPNWGAANRAHRRYVGADYSDGK